MYSSFERRSFSDQAADFYSFFACTSESRPALLQEQEETGQSLQ
jgi:hypothetical protein